MHSIQYPQSHNNYLLWNLDNLNQLRAKKNRVIENSTYKKYIKYKLPIRQESRHSFELSKILLIEVRVIEVPLYI